ncbi:MAG: hypothetical protein KatS3mg111_0552 [Pirellulaceae bacterium]|nr:MAG: hypothetical protein KatS3mg111_0552 [Pirellulaceae bacterium]
MARTFALLSIWLTIAIGGGVFGSTVVFRHWDQQQRLTLLWGARQLESTLVSSLAVVEVPPSIENLTTIIASASATLPSSLTARLAISSAANRSTRPVAPAARDTPSAASASSPWRIERQPAAAGSYLYRLFVPLPHPQLQDHTVEVVLRSSPGEALWKWWQQWLGINLLLLSLTIVWRTAALRRRRKRLASLNQWIQQLNRLTSLASQAEPHPYHSIEFPTDSHLGDMRAVLEHVGELMTEHLNHLLLERSRSRLVLQNLREGVIAVDDHLEVMLINAAAAELVGESSSRLEHRSLVESVRSPQLSKLTEQTITTRQFREAELSLGTPPRLIQVTVAPLPLAHGRWGCLITLRDVTKERRLELVRRDFIANASHELKTPLAAIRAYAETLQLNEDASPVDRQRFVAQIIAQADRLDTLVQGMLQLARVEAGRSLEKQPIDVAQTLRPCVTAAQALCAAKSVEWTDNLAQVNSRLRSSAEALQTITNNLLTNAIRYTDSGGRVSLQVLVSDRQLHLIVQDTGRGIASEDLDRIFERFYRAPSDRATHTSGTGLGLAIVKHLVQELGGRIEVTSRLGSGSTFSIILPRQADSDE